MGTGSEHGGARGGGGLGVGASQNWEAELGSHWSSRTMDGSLLAPLMNSSRDSLPAKEHRSFFSPSSNSYFI